MTDAVFCLVDLFLAKLIFETLSFALLILFFPLYSSALLPFSSHLFSLSSTVTLCKPCHFVFSLNFTDTITVQLPVTGEVWLLMSPLLYY